MAKILHLSDLHGNLKMIHRVIKRGESFDYIILSGDIAPTHVKYMTIGPNGFRLIDREAEAKHQSEWAKNSLRPLLDKVVHKKSIALNGNHCFFDYKNVVDYSLFKGSTTIEIDGLKFGLAVGIKPLNFEWHEELEEGDFEQLLLGIDRDIDVLITHSPPSGILDGTYGGEHIGYQCLYRNIFGLSGLEPRFTRLKAHLFGHAHESKGVKVISFDENRSIAFSNASTGFNVITI